MFHRVVLLRKRTLFISALALITLTVFVRWSAPNGHLAWILLGAGLFPLVFMLVYSVRGRMNPYLLMESTRAEVDRLFSIGAGRKSKLRALRVHLTAYELYERKTGSENLSLYAYWNHLSACINECKRPELPLRERIKYVKIEPSPIGVIDGVLDSDIVGADTSPMPYTGVRKPRADNEFGAPTWGEAHGRNFD